MADRHSEAEHPTLLVDVDEIARAEATNSLLQFDAAMNELARALDKPKFNLKPSLILGLHRILLEGISGYAGIYRPGKVDIRGSGHQPPEAGEVPALVEEMCEYINEEWEQKSSIHLASYALWRLNWIHPFADGNGRTARIVSYLVLCVHTRSRLPGDLTIPEQISKNKIPYYAALEAGDKACDRGRVDVTALEGLMGGWLGNQLYDFIEKAGAGGGSDIPKAELEKVLREARAAGSLDRTAVFDPPRAQQQGLISRVEAHPVIAGAIVTVLVALIGGAVALIGR